MAVQRPSFTPNYFLRDSSGATAILFALSLIPLFGVVGAAIDYASAHSTRTYLQNAADSAALAAVKTRDDATPGPHSVAQATFNANSNALPFPASINYNLLKTDDAATVRVQATLETSFLNLIGFPEFSVDVTARAVRPGFDAEIVLVLDYSSSMDGSKYESMRDGAIDLVKLLTDNLTSPRVKIGLVPFAEEVYLSLPGEHVVDGTPGTTWTNCTNDRKWPYTNSDTTPTADNESKWGRTDSDDTIDPTEYDECGNYPAASLVVRPLTDDHSGTVTQLEAMVPHAGTNIALGLQFGWQVVSANAPFTEGVSDGSKSKIIILLTDGRQHSDGWGSDGNHTVDNAIANIDGGCSAIKSNGITMITVAYELDDDDGKAQLSACASKGEYYFEGDESSIAEQFSDLGYALLNRYLHLTM